ncbi:MAG: hypothetical protein RL326_986 [Pseudomonadota bacterium]|jgi:hypothetical protein
MLRDLFLGKRQQSNAPASAGGNGVPDEEEDDYVEEDLFEDWPLFIFVPLIVIFLIGLFVFVGSLPAIHEHQKNKAISNESVRP